jgi:hypothetical protein
VRQCAAVRAAVCGGARDSKFLFLFKNYIICVQIPYVESELS